MFILIVETDAPGKRATTPAFYAYQVPQAASQATAKQRLHTALDCWSEGE